MRTVLVVDDDRITTALISAWLTKFGYSFIAVFDVAGARMVLETKEVGAVILDLDMPGGCGIELIDYLRASSRTQATPVIVISGHDSPSTITKVMLRGANLFLPKPTDIGRFQQALHTVFPLGSALDPAHGLIAADQDKGTLTVKSADPKKISGHWML